MDMDLRVTYDLSQNVDFNELMTRMDAVEDSLKRWFNGSVIGASSDVFECHGNISTLGSSPHTLEFDTRIEMNQGWKKHPKNSKTKDGTYVPMQVQYSGSNVQFTPQSNLNSFI